MEYKNIKNPIWNIQFLDNSSTNKFWALCTIIWSTIIVGVYNKFSLYLLV